MSAASSCQLPHDAGSTYVVIPTTGLATFEHPLPLVARDHLVEQTLLRARVVEVVIDDLVAEELPGDRPLLERRDRVAERVREAPHVGLVRVALERGPELELLLDPVQARAQQPCEHEIRVRVRAG